MPRTAAIAAGAGLAMALVSVLIAQIGGRAFALGFVLVDWLALGVVIAAAGGAGGAQILWVAPLALVELRPAPVVEWPALTAPALVLLGVLLVADSSLGGSRSAAIVELGALYLAGAVGAGLTSGALAGFLSSRRRARRAAQGSRRAGSAGARRRAAGARRPAPNPAVVSGSARTAPSPSPAARPPERRHAPAGRRPSREEDLDRTTGLPGIGRVAAQVGTCMRRSTDWNVPLSLICVRFTGSGDEERAAAVCARRLSRRLDHDEIAFRVRGDTLLAALLGRDRADAVALAAALEHELPVAVAARAGGRPEVVASVTAYDGHTSLRGLLCDAARAVERELLWEASSR